MKNNKFSNTILPFRVRSFLLDVGAEGILSNLIFLPIILAFIGNSSIKISEWRIIFALASTLFGFFTILTIFRNLFLFRITGAISIFFAFIASFSSIVSNPFYALLISVTLIGLTFFLFENPAVGYSHETSNHRVRARQRTTGSIFSGLILLAFISIAEVKLIYPIKIVLTLIVVTTHIFFYILIKTRKNKRYYLVYIILSLSSFFFSYYILFVYQSSFGIFISIVLIALMLMKLKHKTYQKTSWWEMFFNNPAKILISSFFILAVVGTLLLSLPISTINGNISIVNALFTSVSSVCVTGLTVLNTSSDFTFLGQLFILLLIQLGGLGIMSIATISFHLLGYRLSLKHEKMMASIANINRKNIFISLNNIFKITFTAEVTGAIILSFLFWGEGDHTGMAIWRGIFTSVSAFCNAGFALQNNSLISYSHNPYIIHTIATLIIIGGISPATTLMIPRIVSGKKTPAGDKIILFSSLFLLFFGTLIILLFEWDGLLKNLSFWGKMHNAWFQSVTTRTAGFNTIDFEGIMNQTYMIVLSLMFVGGSPGGTAGGIKTITVAILFAAFWFKISNKDDVILFDYRIRNSYIIKATTILISGILIWFILTIMMLTTQSISPKEIIFEVTSALGTVGLTLGATPRLDEIGKLIIIMAMFIGRIGVLTLFMFLSDEPDVRKSRYPNAEISFS